MFMPIRYYLANNTSILALSLDAEAIRRDIKEKGIVVEKDSQQEEIGKWLFQTMGPLSITISEAIAEIGLCNKTLTNIFMGYNGDRAVCIASQHSINQEDFQELMSQVQKKRPNDFSGVVFVNSSFVSRLTENSMHAGNIDLNGRRILTGDVNSRKPAILSVNVADVTFYDDDITDIGGADYTISEDGRKLWSGDILIVNGHTFLKSVDNNEIPSMKFAKSEGKREIQIIYHEQLYCYKLNSLHDYMTLCDKKLAPTRHGVYKRNGSLFLVSGLIEDIRLADYVSPSGIWETTGNDDPIIAMR